MNSKRQTKKKTHGGNFVKNFVTKVIKIIPNASNKFVHGIKNIAATHAKPMISINKPMVTNTIFNHLNRLNKSTNDAVEKYYNWYYRKHIPKNEWKGKETDRQIINRLFREKQDPEQYGTTIDNYFRRKMSNEEEKKQINEKELIYYLKRDVIHPEAIAYMKKIKTSVNADVKQSSTWDYLKFAVYTVKKSFWDNPIQVEYLYKTETFTALVDLININLTWDPDASEETMNENYNNFYKSLISTVLPILESTFDEYLKDGCEKTVPVVLEHVFGSDNVTNVQKKINANPLAKTVIDKTYQTCNTIAPKIAIQLKTHGLNKGIGEDAKQELIQYMDETTKLCKDIIIGLIEKKLIDFVEIYETAFEDVQKTIDDLVEKTKEEIDKEISSKKIIEKIFIKIKSEIENFEKINVKHAVSTIIDNLKHNTDVQEKEKEIATEIKSKLEQSELKTKVGKITILDFYNNGRETITSLLNAWTDEIDKAIPNTKEHDGYYKAKCLLNVLDLRVSTIIDNVCEIYKSDSLFCDEEIIKEIDKISTNDMTKYDIKSVLKNLTIHIFQTKKQELLQELTYFEKSVVFNYLSLPPMTSHDFKRHGFSGFSDYALSQLKKTPGGAKELQKKKKTKKNKKTVKRTA
jgi:hypothetical protein